MTTTVVCDECGHERTCDFEPTRDDLHEMSVDHKFMCSAEDGVYEVKD